MIRATVIAAATQLAGCYALFADPPIDEIPDVVDAFEDLERVTVADPLGSVLALDGDRAVIALPDGVALYDLGDPTSPRRILRCTDPRLAFLDPGSARALIAGDVLYLLVPTSTGGGVTLYDVPTTPAPEPAILHSVDLDGVSRPFAIDGEVLYTTLGGVGDLRVVDLRGLARAPAGPFAPVRLVDQHVGSGNILSLARRGDLLFVGASGVYHYQLADPLAPVLVGRAGFGGVDDLAWLDADHLVGIGGGHVEIWDVSAPAAPHATGGLAIGHGPRVATQDGYIYVNGIYTAPERPPLVSIVDATDRDAPVLVRTMEIAPGQPHLAPLGDHLVFGGEDGITVYRNNHP